MMRTVLLSLSIVLTTSLVTINADDPKPPKGFRTLFNGNDLSGWYGWNPHESDKLTGEKKEANLKKQRDEFAKHWKVEDGELVNVGTGPYATTEKEFGDIELMIEYKTVAGADSGIYLRGTPQVQIWDKNQKFDPRNRIESRTRVLVDCLTTPQTRLDAIRSLWSTSPSVNGIRSRFVRSVRGLG